MDKIKQAFDALLCKESSNRVLLTRVFINIIMMSFSLHVIFIGIGAYVDIFLCAILVCFCITINQKTDIEPTFANISKMAVMRGYFATITFAFSIVYYLLR